MTIPQFIAAYVPAHLQHEATDALETLVVEAQDAVEEQVRRQIVQFVKSRQNTPPRREAVMS